MNPIFFATFLSLGALVSAGAWAGHEDGSWKGEGLAESQDWGQWDQSRGAAPWSGAWSGAWAPYASSWDNGNWNNWNNGDNGNWNNWNHGDNGNWNQWGNGAWAHGAAPLGHDGRVVDTAEVAHAKAAHFAAKAAAGHGSSYGAGAWGHGAGAWGNGAGAWGHGSWAHSAAPLGHDGRVVDTPEVAHAKAAHFAAKAGVAHGAHGW